MTYHDALVNFALQTLRLPSPVADLVGDDIDIETLGEGEDTAVHLELLASDPADELIINANPVGYVTTLQVTCAARDDSRTATGRASRTLHGVVHARLNAEPSWGDRLQYLGPPSLQFGKSLVQTRLGYTVATYSLRHRTPFNSLEA